MFWTKIFSDFKPKQQGLKKVLGELEADIMEICWNKQPVSVRDVYQELLLRREIAYTTVMTIMGRLADKGLLSKETKGNAFIYTPVMSRSEFTKKVVAQVLDGLLDEFAEPTYNHLVDRMSKEDEAKIEELEKMIKEKRSIGEN